MPKIFPIKVPLLMIFFLNNNLKNFALDYNNDLNLDANFLYNSNNSNNTNTKNSINTKNSMNTNTNITNNNIMDRIIKNPNPFALGESIEKEKPLDIYSSLPTTESYMKYYKSLGEKIGKEFLKINLDKINKCFVDTTEPYRTQFAEPPSLELSLENSKPDLSTRPPNLISSLYNIEISVNLLENLTTCSTLVSTKIIKLMESIWNQKCFQFTHCLALLHFHKNKKYYIFNNLDC